MRVIQTSATADSEGVLHLNIPLGTAGVDVDVAVVVQLKSLNGTHGETTAADLGWPKGFFESTFGSVQDESFVRPPQPLLDPAPRIDE